MARGAVTSLCWALLSILSDEAKGNSEVCKTFHSLKMNLGQTTTYWNQIYAWQHCMQGSSPI
uniref:Uncharacterized protein n=1 Tax=Scylla paramamosain TaxID=85552 RepID=D2DT09_SCYPA|nr:hypothetical protein [Scylla paramamosain]